MAIQAPGRIYPGRVVRVTVDFVDDFDVAVDPGDITFRVMTPCWSESSYSYSENPEVANPRVGRYTLSIPSTLLTEAGRWVYRIETVAPISAIEGDFIVQSSKFFDQSIWDYAS